MLNMHIFHQDHDDVCLSSVLPQRSAAASYHIAVETIIFPILKFREDIENNGASCFTSQPLPLTGIWTDTYAKDAETIFIMKLLKLDVEFREEAIRTIH